MAQYLNSSTRTKQAKTSFLKPVFAAVMLAIMLIAGFGSAFIVKQEQASADLVNDFVCEGHTWAGLSKFGPEEWGITGKGSLTHSLYRVVHTDDLHFALESKSTVNGGTQDVDSLLNSMISWGDKKYSEVNEAIVGYDLKTGEPTGEGFNGGEKVTAFDRFGVAGMQFTRYNGEWRYPYVDVCSDQEPNDQKLSVFYDERLEPRSTYGDIRDSKDIRTVQFGHGMLANIGSGLLNTTANWIFLVTKTIVAVAVTLVNISFVNFADFLGLTELIGSDKGIFSSLYNGIYKPLVLLVLVGTGLMIGYKGIVKREFRGAFGLAIRAVLMFVLAAVIAAAPMFFVSLPNNAAVVLQSLVINSMSTGMASGSEMCTVGGGKVDANPNAPSKALDAKEAQDLLTKASSNMRSIVSCQLWSTFLLKPYSLGQFGSEYNELYAKGKIPSTAKEGSDSLKNDNTDMVGDAGVPMGGGQVINNWALYQISTGTNAHAPTGHEESASPYTNGVANDWYRIVDALANYSEKKSSTDDSATTANGQPIEEVEYMEPDNSKPPTEQWAKWVGGNGFERIGISVTSVFAALAGLASVIFFGFMGAIYSFGIVLVTAFAPLFLLISLWGDKGYETFKNWLQTLLNLIMKRVLLGIILVLNLIILTTILDLMGGQNYFWGVAAMALVSWVLIKLRLKIAETVGGIFSFNFATTDPNSKLAATFGRIRGNLKKTQEGVSNVSAAAIMGGHYARKNGGTWRDGASQGFGIELKNQVYRQDSNFARAAIRSYESLNDNFDRTEVCFQCGQLLISKNDQYEVKVVTDENGNKMCMYCLEERGLTEDQIPANWSLQTIKIKSEENEKEEAPAKSIAVESKLEIEETLNDQITVALENSASKTESARIIGELVGENLLKDMYSKDGVPTVPPSLQPYLGDKETFIQETIKQGGQAQFDVLPALYAKAVQAYIYDEFSEDKVKEEGMTSEEVTKLTVTPGDLSGPGGNSDKDFEVLLNSINTSLMK